MLNVLVVEDEPEELNYLCNIINGILRCCILRVRSGEEALAYIEQKKIDVFFIDVELPGINGFQLAGQIRQSKGYLLTNIVFTTAYKPGSKNIQKRYHHYDYIEKPFTPDSFENELGGMLRELERQKNTGSEPQKNNSKNLSILGSKRTDDVVNIEEILYAERQGRTLWVYAKHETFEGIKMTLEEMISNVGSSMFVRCHKSFALNVENVREIMKIDRRLWYAYFFGKWDTYCQISATYYESVYRLFKER
ncbi:MAG: LytTR family DNA-binding domain-containing protein [Clostridiales Family XIII bacterium]|jgi:DNA-binding LytR/AlgR family response regulator|nr:LytTR family DNA-binding domain-containing protein [Clostridiales Family XIII bacterium]